MKHLTIVEYRLSDTESSYSRPFKTGAEAERWLKSFIHTMCPTERLDYHSFNKVVTS